MASTQGQQAPVSVARALRHWRIKGVVQKLLGAMPGGIRINTRLQRLLGELRDPRANFDAKLGDWQGLIELLRAGGVHSVRGLSLLEIGTGWYPTCPLLFALAGARQVHSYDITPHLSLEMTRGLLEHLAARVDVIAQAIDARPDELSARLAAWRGCTSLPQLLDSAGIVYHAPEDASATSLADGSIDVVFSNSVLEHVDPQVLQPLMRESRRLIGTRGLSVHAVACNDHYAHFDRSISFINYLQFSAAQWRRWNNPLNYQNRLRASDFIAAARAAGLRIVHEQRATRPGTREALAKLKLASDFSHYASEDLLATTVNFVACADAQA
jgi:hypothetical protein